MLTRQARSPIVEEESPLLCGTRGGAKDASERVKAQADVPGRQRTRARQRVVDEAKGFEAGRGGCQVGHQAWGSARTLPSPQCA